MEHLHNNSPIVTSAKFAVVDESGNETWYDFDLDTATEMPQGKLYVFDCRIGEYIAVQTPEQGRAIEDEVCRCFECPPLAPVEEVFSPSVLSAKTIDISVAALCCIYAPPNHTQSFVNTGRGGQTQFFYVTHGTAVFGPTDGVKDRVLVAGEILDIEHLMGSSITGSTSDASAAWVSVNPIPGDRRFDHQLIKGAGSAVVSGDSRVRAVVAIVGDIQVDGVLLREHKASQIYAGQTVNVSVPEGSVAIILVTR